MSSHRPEDYAGPQARIHRHQRREHPAGLHPREEHHAHAIERHIEEHVGPIELVFHEIVSELVHLDVHLVGPGVGRPWNTLVTGGMSDGPMHTPEGLESWRFAELAICLPPDWPLAREAFADEAVYWPLRWLKMLARLPHEYDTWLAHGHSVPNGDPPEPFAPGIAQCCMLVRAPALLPESFCALQVAPGKVVHFWTLVPIYEEEMVFKLRHGTEALDERLQRAGVTELLQIGRPNTCDPRR